VYDKQQIILFCTCIASVCIGCEPLAFFKNTSWLITWLEIYVPVIDILSILLYRDVQSSMKIVNSLTLSRSINTQQNNLAKIQPSWPLCLANNPHIASGYTEHWRKLKTWKFISMITYDYGGDRIWFSLLFWLYGGNFDREFFWKSNAPCLPLSGLHW